jgi:hypothetical protein
LIRLNTRDRIVYGETDTMAEITAALLNFLKAIGKYRWHAVAITWTIA